MLRVTLFPALLAAFVAGVSAQSNKLLDNDEASVVLAVDQPHAKGQPHEHKTNRVMIYLTAGRQEITPVGGTKTVLQVKAGDVKWSPASGMHVSEVTSDAPLKIVEVLLKKDGDPAKAHVTTALDPLKVDPKHYHLVFENSQVRVIRVKMEAHAKIPLHEHVLNRVVVYLTDQSGSTTTPDGKTETAKHAAGEVSDGGPVKHSEVNLKDSAFECIVVEFKS